jgi:uncharacterized protein YbjT (DUF2867 family)
MYVLLGANGNITSKTARLLLAKGKAVRVVGRDRQHLEPLRQAGADIALGSVADARFLAEALRGAKAVYTMLPPNYAAADPLAESARTGAAIVEALQASGLTQVVNLSSIGAHLPAGTGPIVGLHAQEARLATLKGVSILNLRPGYFYENHLAAIGTIRALDAYADLIDPNVPVPSVATADIAAVAARELVAAPPGTGTRVLHLHGPRLYTPVEAAEILGAAIGRPDLRYVKGDAAQAKAAMTQHGISPAMADLFAEMSAAFGRADFTATLEAGPTETTPTTLEQFAPVFAEAYTAAARAERVTA